MSLLSQLPGSLDLEFIRGDDFTFTLNFGMDLSTYYLTAQTVFHNSAGSKSFAINVSSPTVGTVILSLDDVETLAFPASTDHTWSMKWWSTGTTIMRTIINGSLSAL